MTLGTQRFLLLVLSESRMSAPTPVRARKNHRAAAQGDCRSRPTRYLWKEVRRMRLIQVWFAAVLLVVVAGIAFGTSVTVSAGATLLALSLVPPAIVLLFWPGVQSRTAAEVPYGSDRRD
jgi:hypothetical protein